MSSKCRQINMRKMLEIILKNDIKLKAVMVDNNKKIENALNKENLC